MRKIVRYSSVADEFTVGMRKAVLDDVIREWDQQRMLYGLDSNDHEVYQRHLELLGIKKVELDGEGSNIELPDNSYCFYEKSNNGDKENGKKRIMTKFNPAEVAPGLKFYVLYKKKIEIVDPLKCD